MLFLSPSAVIQYLTAAYEVGAYGTNGTHSIQYIGDTLLANALQQAALLGLYQPLIAANQALFVYPDPSPYNSVYFESAFMARAGFRPGVFGMSCAKIIVCGSTYQTRLFRLLLQVIWRTMLFWLLVR